MKSLIIHIIICLLTFSSFGQRKKVELTVTPDEVSIGQTVTVTIKSNMEGDLIENLPSCFVPGYGVNSYSQYIQDVNTGEMIQEHIVVLNGAFSKAGTFKVGPFYVKDGNKSKASNVVSVRVVSGSIVSTEDFSKEQLRKPAFGIIERSSDKIYEGQALILTARVYSKDAPTGQPLRKRNYEVKGVVESHDLSQFNKNYIEIVSLKGKEYSTFSYDKKVIFPTGAGILDITPFNVMIPFGSKGYDVQSNVPQVEVLALPGGAPKNFIGGVGVFDISQKIELKKLKQGDVFTFDVIISGNGNLHNLDKPKLPLTNGMIVYGDPVLTEEYTFGSKGASGQIIYTYNIQVTKSGEYKMPAVGLSYFDPFLEKYISIKADSISTIKVDVNPSYEGVDPKEINPESQQVNMDRIAPLTPYRKQRSSNLFGTSLFWIGITSPIALAFLFIFFIKKREESSEIKASIQQIKSVKQDSIDYIQNAKKSINSNDPQAFYSNLEKGLTAICVASTQLSSEEIHSKSELYSNMIQNGIASEQIAQIKAIFEQCDNARYGIAGNLSEQESLLAATYALINQLN